MSTISLRQDHSKTSEELRDLIRQLAIKLEDKYQLKSSWVNDDELVVQRTGIKGRISLAPKEVRVEIKLGLMMSAFKATIQTEIARSMAEKLG